MVITQKQKHKLVIGGLLSTTILSTCFLSSTLVSADDSIIDIAKVSVPMSCTLTGTGQTSHTATIQNGQYNSSIGETTLKAFCNDSEGFIIYAIGYTDNINGKNTMVNPEVGSAYSIVTGTATSGGVSNWSMKLSTVSSPTPTYPITIQNSYGSFHNIPTSYEVVASRDSGTDIGTSAEGSILKTTYQVYISPTQPAGTYTGQVKYTLAHPAIDALDEDNIFIFYDKNGDNVQGSMSPQYASGETVLSAPNYARSGYGFAAWNTSADGTGTNLGPNQTIDLDDYTSLIDSNNHTLTLYAKWIPAEQNVTMQTFDDTVEPYASATTNTVIALRDERDNDVYAVAKLADDNWWMIENLRIDGSVDAATMAAGSQGIGGDFTKLPESANIFRGNTFNETYPAELNLTVYTLPQINTTNTVFAEQDEDAKYAYGNYYSFAAAIADTTPYTTQSATTSICPKGWTLPSINNADEGYTNLHHAMGGEDNGDFTPEGSNRWRSYPLNFVYSGRFNNGFTLRGSSSAYRTSTSTGNQAYFTSIRADALSTVSATGKTTGMSVRCYAN